MRDLSGDVGTQTAMVWDVVRLFVQLSVVFLVGAAVVWAVRRAARCIAHWRYTARFVEPLRPTPRIVADRPYNADQVLHTVGCWEYLKERLGLGDGPHALCGYRLYSELGEAVDDPLFDEALWCPDCEVRVEGLSRLTK